MDELAEFRPIVDGAPVLFLGRDNFVLYSLRGSRPFTHVRNFYDPYFVKPNFEIEQVASKFDFDSVTPEKLKRFPYVITTRAAYASGPPPEYEMVGLTGSYALWRKRGDPTDRIAAESGPGPTGKLRCGGDPPEQATVFLKRPVVEPADSWTPSATVEGGASGTTSIDLPGGQWLLSLQYDSTRPIEVTAPGMSARLPGNLDYRGTAPFWAAGRLEADGKGPVEVEVSVEEPPLAGRILGANSVVHLGALAATPAEGGYAKGVPEPALDYSGSDPVFGPAYGGASAFLLGRGGLFPGRFACGRQADWYAAR